MGGFIQNAVGRGRLSDSGSSITKLSHPGKSIVAALGIRISCAELKQPPFELRTKMRRSA
jgi:hypothetical protein